VRFLISLVLASCVVLGLFVAMERLVKGVQWKPEKGLNAVPIEFVRLKREEATQTRERRVPNKPPEPEAPPPPRVKLDQALAPPGSTIDVSMPKVDTTFRSSGTGAGAFFDPQTTAVIPLARVQPQYPQQALIDGIEGWVEVEFTITEFGTVEDPRVLASSPRGVFENSALRAIVRWKFKPKVENGVPVRFPRARYRLEYILAKEGTQ
jgi:periplasmic protein TonB